MGSKLGRAVAGAVGLMALLAPSAAYAGWWDGGYDYKPPRQSRSPAPPPGPVGPFYGCENSDLPATAPLLYKTTTPPPGSTVHPGQEILVEITWRVTDWTSPDLHKVLDCVYINDRYAPELSGGERPTPNDGHFAFHYFVPADAPPGTVICDQGFASGPNGQEEYGRGVSDVLCFTVEGPPPPAPPPPPPAETTTTTTTTTEQPATTTTTTYNEEQPYTESERFDQQTPAETDVPAPFAPPGAVVLPRDVLPRTGGDANPARLAAGALARNGARRRRR
jgi:hypothetical protein